MTQAFVPVGFIRISDAVAKLAKGMWGCLPRPVPVQEIKAAAPKLSVGFGPWREEAAKVFRAAALDGKLPVFIIPDTSVESSGPAVVPAGVLKGLITSRGGLPDHPIRPSQRAMRGLLVVRTSDFSNWYRSEYSRTRWASQRSSSRALQGRPTKDSEAIRNAILASVRDGRWSGRDSIMKLHRLLADSGRFEMPSHDTLGRLVKQLQVETGDPALRRIERRRKRT